MKNIKFYKAGIQSLLIAMVFSLSGCSNTDSVVKEDEEVVSYDTNHLERIYNVQIEGIALHINIDKLICYSNDVETYVDITTGHTITVIDNIAGKLVKNESNTVYGVIIENEENVDTSERVYVYSKTHNILDDSDKILYYEIDSSGNAFLLSEKPVLSGKELSLRG